MEEQPCCTWRLSVFDKLELESPIARPVTADVSVTCQWTLRDAEPLSV